MTVFIVGRVTHDTTHDSPLNSSSFRCTAELSAQWPLTLGLRSSEDVALTRRCGRASRCPPPGGSGAVGSPHPTRQSTTPSPLPSKLNGPLSIVVNCHRTKSKVKDHRPSRKPSLWRPTGVVRHASEGTTQFHGAVSTGDVIKGAYKSPPPAMDVLRQHGPVATDTAHTSHPAIGASQTAAQAPTGRETRHPETTRESGQGGVSH